MDYFKAVTSNNLAKLIYEESIPIKKRLHPKDTTSEPANYDKILQAVGSARVVLIGEASHGTEEFYQHRAELTKRLICEKDFNIVALEADWPDTHRVCSYVRGNGEDKNAVESLGEFKRFPRWMWRNTVMVDFVEWLKEHNDKLEYDEKVGIFGLDLYSLHSSRAEVIEYLEKFHPEAVAEAKKRYSCFDHYGDEGQAYGYSVGFGLSKGCQQEAVKQLSDMLASKTKWLDSDKSLSNADRLFYANQNAKVVKDAETYYRNMFQSSNVTWNIRDKHMVDTLGDLLKHFTETKRGAKAIVWAHNSHVGDTKGRVKEYNIGQLARERYGQENTFNIGFSTFSGTVTAADNWDEPPNRMKVRNALEGSYEQLFHEASLIHDEQTKHQKQDFCLLFRSNSGSDGVVSEKLAKQMAKERLERAIGVVYRPSTERWSHYFEVNLADQFDCLIHFDSTRALTPLEREPQWKEGADEMDETFPFGV